jgi:hypothetical protein
MKATIFFTQILAACIAITLLTGCSKNRFKPLADYMKQLDELDAGYFHGDAAAARDSLGKMIQYYQDPHTQLLADAARAQMTWQTYCRLYLLETRTGNVPAAQDDLDKARQWESKFYKLANVPDTSAHDLTPDKIESLVDEIDKRENNGQLPQYTQSLGHQTQ